MNRERQVLQDINRHYGEMIEFSQTDDVNALEFRDVKKIIEVPARIEGRFRKEKVTVKELARVATYASLSDYFANKKESSGGHYYSDPWTIDDMPEDVLERYAIWHEQADVPSDHEIRVVLHEEAGKSVDRMTAVQECPDCLSQTRYACRTSGWSRELYRYPLIQVRDMNSSQVYDVPLDVALYVDQQPQSLRYGPQPRFSESGFMSAYYQATLTGDRVSGDYVRRVTNNRIDPQSESLEILPGAVGMSDIVVYLGGWQENGINTYMDNHTAREIVQKLQDTAARRHAERVTNVNYNELFDSLRQKLGSRGLSLAFRYVYEGMGESSAEFSVLNGECAARGSVRSIDAYEALTELSDKLSRGGR